MFDQRLNELSAQITKMTPQQRQKFAMLHKNDPILVSLTKFVNDQENAVRNGAKAASLPEAVAQPKVVDQTIQSMGGPMITPPPRASQAGVAGLSAPNLASMPDGGIAGQPVESEPSAQSTFADGGVVRYAEGGTLMGPMGVPLTGPDGRVLYGYGPEEPETTSGIMDFLRRPLFTPKASKKNKLEEERQRNMSRVNNPDQRPTMANDPRLLGATPPMPVETPAAAAPAPAQSVSDKAREALFNLVTQPPTAAEPPVSSGGGGGGGGAAPAGIAALPTMSPPPTLEDPGAMFDRRMASLPKELDPARREEVAKARTAAAEGNLADLKASQEELGVAGLEREKRLKKREAKLDAAEEENKGLALLSAGLAMMAGTSPNAFANIGAGAQVGVKQFMEGKARLDASREKLEDAFAALEELRRNEKRLNSNEMRQAKAGVRAAVVENMNDAYRAVADMYGVNARTAVGMVDAAIKQQASVLEATTRREAAQLGAASRIQAAGISAAATRDAARTNRRDRDMSAKVMGLAALIRNDPDDPNKLAKLASDMRAKIASEVKADPLLMAGGPGAMEAEVNRRFNAWAMQAGVPQLAGSSAGGQTPAFRYNPQTGSLDPYQ